MRSSNTENYNNIFLLKICLQKGDMACTYILPQSDRDHNQTQKLASNVQRSNMKRTAQLLRDMCRLQKITYFR